MISDFKTQPGPSVWYKWYETVTPTKWSNAQHLVEYEKQLFALLRNQKKENVM